MSLPIGAGTGGGTRRRNSSQLAQPLPIGSRSPALQQALAGGGGTGTTPGQGDPAAGGAKPAGPKGAPMVDLSADPILKRIRALYDPKEGTYVRGAEDTELAGRKQALVGYGYDPALQGLYPDESTAEAARQNPFSVLASLLYEHQQGTHNLDENLNRQNLYYSGYRGTKLAEEGRTYQARRTGAFSGLNGNLGQLGAALLAAKNYAADQETQGLADAYSRYKPSDVADGTGATGTTGGTGTPAGFKPTPRAQVDALASGKPWQDAQTYASVGATPEAIPAGHPLLGPTSGPGQPGMIDSSMTGQADPLALLLGRKRKLTRGLAE